ncbi:mll4164 [Mesorhizobium japonicum MAFF 303099]|uniref:Mll4164 protein n=1 Tax=Mesorhizobium japonicum (strain LMG 29417 / CECT 9101 / MAFF 303099) TaxID=266835 RepID=Q98EN7_RHILO|nr:mll4164 [Mesorhizobium japonicum MAFF 303099]
MAHRLAQRFDLLQVETAFRAQYPEVRVIGAVDLDGLHHEVEMGVEGVRRAPQAVGLPGAGHRQGNQLPGLGACGIRRCRPAGDQGLEPAEDTLPGVGAPDGYDHVHWRIPLESLCIGVHLRAAGDQGRDHGAGAHRVASATLCVAERPSAWHASGCR